MTTFWPSYIHHTRQLWQIIQDAVIKEWHSYRVLLAALVDNRTNSYFHINHIKELFLGHILQLSGIVLVWHNNHILLAALVDNKTNSYSHINHIKELFLGHILQLSGIVLVECNLKSLDVMTQFDSWRQF